MATTHHIFFSGDSIRTTVTHDPATVSRWISEVESMHGYQAHQLIVGLDVEWRPSYSSVPNPPATLQLCVDRSCLVYQLIHSPGISSSLNGFFTNPKRTFVGVGINADLEKLKGHHGFGFNADSVDLRELAANAYRCMELRNSGLKELARVVLGKDVAKPQAVTMSRWDNQWLSPDQIQYACIDAFVCSEIGRSLIPYL